MRLSFFPTEWKIQRERERDLARSFLKTELYLPSRKTIFC